MNRQGPRIGICGGTASNVWRENAKRSLYLPFVWRQTGETLRTIRRFFRVRKLSQAGMQIYKKDKRFTYLEAKGKECSAVFTQWSIPFK